MGTNSRAEVDLMMKHIEETWSQLDMLFDAIDAEGRWSEKHGEDWTYADLPYHMGYCERDLVARVMELGPDVPDKDRWETRTINQLNAWNAERFAERPADQTAEQSLEQMHATRDYIRRVTSSMSDADLEVPAWFHLTFGTGWQTKRNALQFCRQHSWSEFMQLRIHMGKDAPEPSSEVTSIALQGYLWLSVLFMDRKAAADASLTTVIEFTDDGVGPWTLAVENGKGEVRDGAAEAPDLVMTQSAEAFVKSMNGIQDPAELMQNGEIKVSSFEALGVFGALFHPPDPDQVF